MSTATAAGATTTVSYGRVGVRVGGGEYVGVPVAVGVACNVSDGVSNGEAEADSVREALQRVLVGGIVRVRVCAGVAVARGGTI